MTLFALLMGAGPTWADELTVYDGSATNDKIPVNGYYADYYLKSEFVIPADDIEAMNGGTVTSMTFYLSNPASKAIDGTFVVFLKEIDATTISAYSGYEASNVVYEGTVDITGSTMTINFANSYQYNGENLLVGFYQTAKSSGYPSCSFYGTTVTGASLYGYNSSSLASANKNSGNFIPKTTFNYTPGAGVSVSKPKNATIGWDAVEGADSYELSYSTDGTEPDAEGSYTSVNTNSYNLTGLTSGTTYYVYVRTVKAGNKSKWSAVCSFTPGTLTINNVSSTTNNYVPIYGNYMDDHSRSQFIMPKASLTSLAGTQITKIIFYGTASNESKFNNKTFNVYLKEVDDATISSLSDWASLEQVYSGNLKISDGKMTITLDEGFDYSGDKNLLIGINQTDDDGDYTSTTWTGVSASGASMGGYGSSISQQNFLPQTTFYFAPQVATVKKPKNFDDTATTATTATFSWTAGSDETAWQISYMDDPDFDPDEEGTKVTVNANPFTLTGLDASTTYYAYIRAEKGGEYSAWSNMAEFTTLSAAPIMELSTTSISFGIVSNAAAQAQTFTVSNTGGVDLNAFSVKPAGDGFMVTDTEGNELPQTIAAGETLTVKVVMNALGEHTANLIVAGNDVPDQQVAVSGYMLDDTKIAETFASKPDRWTASSGWSYNATTGAYSTTYGGSTLTSPKIAVGEGETLTISAKSGYTGESYYVKIEGSADNGSTWTAYTKQLSTASDPALSTTDFTVVTLDDVPTTVNKLRITSYYGYINALNGFTYDEDPQLALYSNEECTTSQAATATKNWGFVAEAQQQKYYIKNTGNGQIDLTIEQADGFTAAVDDAALAEGEKATLTIDMAATEGLHEGTITVTAKNHKTNEVLGTFAVTLNAGVAGSKNDIDFVGGSLSALPAGWETTGWTVTNSSYVGVSSTAYDLTSQEYTVGDGENLLIEAKL